MDILSCCVNALRIKCTFEYTSGLKVGSSKNHLYPEPPKSTADGFFLHKLPYDNCHEFLLLKHMLTLMDSVTRQSKAIKAKPFGCCVSLRSLDRFGLTNAPEIINDGDGNATGALAPGTGMDGGG